MKKILIYYSHRQSLGHTNRVLNLTKKILKDYSKKSKIYIFNAGLSQNFFSFSPRVFLMNLPCPFHNKNNFKHKSKVASAEIVNLRIKFMLENIKKIKPDIFITEFFPFGRPECISELLPVLRFLKSKKTPLFASIGYPYINPFFVNKKNVFYLLLKFFNKLLIHTPPDFENKCFEGVIRDKKLKKGYQQLFALAKEKIIYTGYIIAEDVDKISQKSFLDHLKQNKKKIVLVSRGGGVVYPKIIISAILAAKSLGNDWFFIIIPGPSSGKKQLDFFTQLIEKNRIENILLKSSLQKLYCYIKYCDISVSMAGYNTSVELLYFKKRSIIIPWQGGNSNYFNDQLSRSLLLNNYLGAKVISYQDLNQNNLKVSLQKHLKTDLACSSIKRSFFRGAQVSADVIMNY